MYKPEAALVEEILSGLGPEELEPRLELLLFIDPMTSLGTSLNNQNIGNQQQQHSYQQEIVVRN